MSIARMIAGSGQRIIPVEFIGYVHSAGGSATVLNGVDFEPGDLMVSYSGSYGVPEVNDEVGWTLIARDIYVSADPGLGDLQSVAVAWRIAGDSSSYRVDNGNRDNLILVFRSRPDFSPSVSGSQLVLNGGAASAAVPSDKASAWIAISSVASGGVTTSYSGAPQEVVANPDCKFAYKFYPQSNAVGVQTATGSGVFEACVAVCFAFE